MPARGFVQGAQLKCCFSTLEISINQDAKKLQVPTSNPDKQHRDLGGIQRSSKVQAPKSGFMVPMHIRKIEEAANDGRIKKRQRTARTPRRFARDCDARMSARFWSARSPLPLSTRSISYAGLD